jgi:MoxR-like ATPase
VTRQLKDKLEVEPGAALREFPSWRDRRWVGRAFGLRCALLGFVLHDKTPQHRAGRGRKARYRRPAKPRVAMNTPERIQQFRDAFQKLRDEIGKVIVGHADIVDGTLTALFGGGHVLLEGVPGLGKTLLVRTLSEVMNLSFSRIQFTPDLMPADILGTNLVVEDANGRRAFEFQKGPIFAHLLLADEINRATPKTQSAMLEAMQEKQVTAGGELRPLPKPFFVLATQNPIDQEGTYPLPEAQLDRFFFKLVVGYPGSADMTEILNRTTEGHHAEIHKVIDGEALTEFQQLVRQVPAATHVKDFAVRLVLATHPKTATAAPVTNQYLRFGSSPRGAQCLLLGSKVRALTEGRYNVSIDDILAVATPTLRHRLILNFEAEAEGITTDHVIATILKELPKEVGVAA